LGTLTGLLLADAELDLVPFPNTDDEQEHVRDHQQQFMPPRDQPHPYDERNDKGPADNGPLDGEGTFARAIGILDGEVRAYDASRNTAQAASDSTYPSAESSGVHDSLLAARIGNQSLHKESAAGARSCQKNVPSIGQALHFLT
jgi:hypothetical protein